MAIEPPNAEADEAHDIVMKQRGYERLHKDLKADAAKLALFDELFAVAAYWCPNGEPLREQVDLPSVMHNQQWWKAQGVFARARAIK